jgi:hypothetical protein
MADTEGSLEGSVVAQAFKPAKAGLKPRATLIAACLTLSLAARAAAQQPVVAPAPAEPEFLSRYDFHLTASALLMSPSSPTAADDQRFAWDTRFGGTLDVVDYVGGRAGVVVDYQAVLGSEYRPFDPNQGSYTLEGFASARIGDATEIVGMFHHVSRHLSDRPKRFAIAWNELGGRILHRVTLGPATIDVDLKGGRIVQHSYVDYTWLGELNVLLRRPVNDHVGVFAHGSGQTFAVDDSVPKRGTQAGGLVEAGLRLNGRAGALELFAGFEKRVDADPVDRQPQHWVLAGFRLLSR